MPDIHRSSEPYNLAGTHYYAIEELRVMEFHEQPDGKGEPTQVHLAISVEGLDAPLVVRFHSHHTISHLIEALTVHRDQVWPSKGGIHES